MTGMKPNIDMIMQRKVSGDSLAHVLWSAAKKKAAQNGADVSKLPKEDLGPLLVNFRQYLRGAGEVSRYFKEWKDWDPKTLKPLKETRKKIESAAFKYQQVCTQQANTAGIAPAVKKAWQDLNTAAGIAEQEPHNMLTKFNTEQQKDNLLKLDWNKLKG